MTGDGFTTRTGSDAGTDTTVWVWARTGETSGVMRQAKVWRVTDNSLTATLPDDIPFGMYLVWVENEAGVSTPICLNRTISHWVGPLGNAVQAGNKKRVFGRNISYGHGTTTSYVYIQPASGGAMTACTVNTVNPYMVEFTVPAGTANGNYKVFVHNGHGGAYGWSDALDLVVQNEWVRGSDEITLSPSGGDDTSAIQSALVGLSGRPNGGTLRLSAGTFKTYSMITLKGKVRLLGAGMDSTTIELRLNSGAQGYLMLGENNAAIEGLTLKGYITGAATQPGAIINMPYPTPWIESFKMTNTRVTAEDGVYAFYLATGVYRTELSGCEFYRAVGAGWIDGWIHNCKLYGGPYGVWSPITPNYTGETEAAYNMTTRAVFENSHIETKNWPINGDGNMNYTEFVPYTTYGIKVWAKRVALVQNNPLAHNYLANLTTKDVAVQDNRGEMILLHGMPAQWFGNVLSMSGLTMNLRTDGTVNGAPGAFLPDYTNPSDGVTGGSTVPDAHPFYIGLDGSSAIIISGRGLGQQRKVVSHTATSIVIEKPWKIAPDSTSVVLITPLYVENTIYNNELNAFPPNYDIQDIGNSASTGVDFDGNSWNCAVEGNTSRRTNSARCTFANGGPTYWCVMRDETAIDAASFGYRVDRGDVNPSGFVLLGNAVRSSSSNSAGTATNWGEGAIIEDMAIVGGGYRFTGTYQAGAWPHGFGLFRKSQVTSAQPVYVSNDDRNQYLIDNTYTGASQNYWYAAGLSGWTNPVAPYRVARFTGHVGYPVAEQLIPVANAGTSPMTWTLTPSDSWIAASIQSNGNLSPESTLGRLVIGVNTSGMSAGRHWGSVTVSAGGASAKVGVCLDLASGSPPGQAPVAAFSAAPLVGTSPLAVTFNASASTDADGLITDYYWDFGDGTYASGQTVAHTYTSAGTLTPVLTVTDNSGATGSAWRNVSVSPAINSVTISGNPIAPIDPTTAVTFTAMADGGYQTQYRFFVRAGSGGWTLLSDYQISNTCIWTPGSAGYYEIKAQAKASDSTRVYDKESSVLSYPVGQIPAGMKLWLKADTGVTRIGLDKISVWADQSGSGNNVFQSNGPYQPVLVSDGLNGRPVVRFAGGSQRLETLGIVLSGATPFTTFLMAKFNSVPASTYQYLWWNGIDDPAKGYGCHTTTTPRFRCAWGSWSKSVVYQSDVVTNTWYNICSRFAGGTATGNHQMWVNGTLAGSNTKTDSNLAGGTFTLGNQGSTSQGFYGDVAEMIIYNRSLTDEERAGVENYLSQRWSPPVAVQLDRLRDVKALGDAVLVTITSPKAAAVASGVYSDGSVYVIESDRTAGLKVTGAGTVALWENLSLTGTTDTDQITGERVLRVTSISKAAGTELNSLGMNGKAVIASGQLVRVWGKVKEKTSSYLTLDDGSGVTTKVQIDGLVTSLTTIPNVGDYMSATGPAGLIAGGVTAVRVRSGSDIRVY